MAYTVPVSFDSFYEAINLGGDHRETANKRRDRVIELLSGDFDILDAFSSGSIPKYTALKKYADLDVIVVLHYGKHIEGKRPSEVLSAVRKSLSGKVTGARRNGQAVTLKYESWPSVDIVPVSRTIVSNGDVTHYNVPDENTETWIMAKPKTHAKAIEDRSTVCGANFRKVIKMIKSWNRNHGDYLQSYHIEVLALRIFNSAMTNITWDIFSFFDNARPLLVSAIYHDTGFVDDYLTYSDRQEVLKRFDTAIIKSRSAWYHTSSGKDDHKAAIETWKQIFGDKFPAYG